MVFGPPRRSQPLCSAIHAPPNNSCGKRHHGAPRERDGRRGDHRPRHGSMMRLRLGARGPSSSAQGVLALSPAITQAVRGFACDGFLALSSVGPQLLRNCLGHSRSERRCGAQCPYVLIAASKFGTAARSPPAQLHTPRCRPCRGLHTITHDRTASRTRTQHAHTRAKIACAVPSL